jgi:hypothetical protein
MPTAVPSGSSEPVTKNGGPGEYENGAKKKEKKPRWSASKLRDWPPDDRTLRRGVHTFAPRCGLKSLFFQALRQLSQFNAPIYQHLYLMSASHLITNSVHTPSRF